MAPDRRRYEATKQLLEGVQTVCQSARCPNRVECHSMGTATFLLLGKCTRSCGYCAVPKGSSVVDPEEPAHVAEAARLLRLHHVVLTSVTRDDLPDGGASQFIATMRAVRTVNPGCVIELLVPELDSSSLGRVLAERPSVLGHNLETVPRLYPTLRPGADYRDSLGLLKRSATKVVTKTGIMVGLGESEEELGKVFYDIARTGCRILTIGQYLRPGAAQFLVQRTYTDDEFQELAEQARRAGIAVVYASRLVRSSYHASEQLASARA